MSTDNKNYFIDNLKVLLIFLVVFGHLIERYIDTNNTLLGIYLFIYTFHMPLFIFVSGFLSKNINKSKKIFLKQLLLPYIVFNIIWYGLVYLYTGEAGIPILYPGWTLWFLLSLFCWRISIKYLIRIKYILPVSFVLGVCAGLVSNGSLLSISRTIVFLPFFLLGYYSDINKFKNIIDKININIAVLGMILFLFIALLFAENSILDYRFLYGSLSYIELGINLWKGIFYRVLLYFSSIVLGIFICRVTPNTKNMCTHISKSTMYVYVFHIYIVILIFYLIPIWDLNKFTNLIILISPVFITYILSRNFFEKAYFLLFNPIVKLLK